MRDTIVSKGFRQAVLSTYEKLVAHPSEAQRLRWFRFLDLILFPTAIDDSSTWLTHPVIAKKEIMDAIGLPLTTNSRTFTAERFLKEIVDNKVLGKFGHGGYDGTTGRARYAIPNFPKALKAAIEHETATLHTVPEEERVHLVTGDPWRATTPAQLRSRDLERAAAVPSPVPEAQRIISYLNGLDSNLFTKRVKANIAKATDAAMQLPPNRKLLELTKLHRIVSQPQPFYGPSDKQKTVRVFAKGTAIQHLKNEVKYALTDGWVTFDLRSSQLAIIARDWGIDDLRDWLFNFNDNNIWRRLSGHFPSVHESISKPVLKAALYSVCYGAGRPTIRNDLTKGLGLADVEPFFNDPFIVRVLQRRRDVMAEVIKNKGVVDCFGRTIPCTGKADIRSVMAQVSQAREMQLLIPAIDLARARRNEFRIVLWEHDGFSVHFIRKDDAAKAESERIINAVNAECTKLRYPTRLERKAP